MTASQTYLLEPLSQDFNFTNTFNPAHPHYGATPSTCVPVPRSSQAMNHTYLESEYQYQDQRAMPGLIEGHSMHGSSSLSQANYYRLPTQQIWQQPAHYSSGGAIAGPSSAGSVGYGYQGGSLWQSTASYGGSNDNQYLPPSDSYSAYPTESPASVPSDLSNFSLGSPAAAYHYSPAGSTGSPHALATMSVSPEAVTLSVTQSPPPQATSIPSHSSSATQTVVSTTKKYSYREEYQLFLRAMSLPALNFGPFVPQTIYKPHTTSDRKRYVEEISLEGPLYFAMSNPSEFGIPLNDALHSRVKRLVDRERPVFEGRGPSVSIRLEWPGYRQWTRQIPTKDFRSPPGPITMAKLAKNIAKCVQRFIDENKDRNLEDTAHRRWKVGVRPNELKLDDLVLVSLHHVSLGSWQPHIRLRRPLSVV